MEIFNDDYSIYRWLKLTHQKKTIPQIAELMLQSASKIDKYKLKNSKKLQNITITSVQELTETFHEEFPEFKGLKGGVRGVSIRQLEGTSETKLSRSVVTVLKVAEMMNKNKMNVDKDYLKKMIILQTVLTYHLVKYLEKTYKPKQPYGAILIYDLEKVNVLTVGKFANDLKDVIKETQHSFSGITKKIVIYKAPMGFKSIFAAVKVFLAERLAESIKFCSNFNDMKKAVGEDNTPPEYGGKLVSEV
uniref:CRAL-TRIO domain-containing protein n=1 Tax=Ditylenchus dipsaci TaxID=166011 RepID=A0A915DXS2_9BILA